MKTEQVTSASVKVSNADAEERQYDITAQVSVVTNNREQGGQVSNGSVKAADGSTLASFANYGTRQEVRWSTEDTEVKLTVQKAIDDFCSNAKTLAQQTVLKAE